MGRNAAPHSFLEKRFLINMQLAVYTYLNLSVEKVWWRHPFFCLISTEVITVVIFSGFFPVVINFLRRVPVIGNILNLPGISMVCRLNIFHKSTVHA